jgi:hypothetical protein
MDRAAQNHYPTSDLAKIKALDVRRQLRPVPVGNGAHAPAGDRGQRGEGPVGTGYWFRNQHELLLVGTRGRVPAPAMGTQWPTLIHALV